MRAQPLLTQSGSEAQLSSAPAAHSRLVLRTSSTTGDLVTDVKKHLRQSLAVEAMTSRYLLLNLAPLFCTLRVCVTATASEMTIDRASIELWPVSLSAGATTDPTKGVSDHLHQGTGT